MNANYVPGCVGRLEDTEVQQVSEVIIIITIINTTLIVYGNAPHSNSKLGFVP